METIPEFNTGDYLRKAREVGGYQGRQRDFAKAIGISHGALTSYELGKTRPRPPVLAAWSLATGVPVYWLLTGHAEPSLPRMESNHQPAGYRPVVRNIKSAPSVVQYDKGAATRANPPKGRTA